jgi:hypothetical protein
MSKTAESSRRVTRAASKLHRSSDVDPLEEPIPVPAVVPPVATLPTVVTPVVVTPVIQNTAAVPDSPSSTTSDPSSTDSDFTDAYTHPFTTNMTSNANGHAVSLYTNLSHPPILSEGELTPKTLLTFEEDCNSYFLNAKGGVADEQKVLRVLNSFRDTHVRNWITTDRAALIALSFEDFMQRLRTEFLPPNWEDKVRSRILGSKMPRNERFIHWARSLQAENYVLRGTTSHLPDDRLRDTLEANVDLDLRILASDISLAVRASLTDWMNQIEKLDAKRKLELKRHRDLLSDELHHAKRQNTRSGPSYSSYISQNVDPSAPSAPQTRRKGLPSLTLSERALLRDNDGCYKCRRFFQDHRTANCHNDFPSPDSYKTLTSEDVARAKARTEKKPPSAAPSRKPKPVAALQDATHENASTAALDYSSDGVYATFGPTAASSVLGNGSFSEGENSVSLPPLRSKHFVWKCYVDSGPTADLPLTAHTLIDNGAHIVLIRPQLVEQLHLPVYELDEPEEVDVAINTSCKEKKKQLLSSYVILRVTSLDHSFVAKPVRALITPGLCMPIILGLPWLEHNKIVCDHADRSCIVKDLNYDLLRPPAILPPAPRKLKIREQIAITKKLKKLALRDLIDKFKTDWALRRAADDKVKEVDVVAAIRTRIATISILDDLEKRGAQIRQDYATVFKPIPHMNQLPTQFQARIKLKDAEKTIKNRSYSTPRKFAEAWSVLIADHLKAGRIQPSESSFASPAFLIPKSDPTALPRWVNDYRQLNDNTVTNSHPLPRIDDILNDCAKGRIWSTIDMTHAFFQTRMHPEAVPLTAVNTPLGLYEWLVMPMGLKNAPSIHQRRVTGALRHLIGRICHIFLDDIVVWSRTIEEHDKHLRQVFTALQEAGLFVHPKKCHLFRSEIRFLGHKISRKGIEADEGKADRILQWPQPTNAHEARSFLGLVRYIANFLPDLAEHTEVLNELTHRSAEKKFPSWDSRYQQAFDGVKRLVTSRDCLTTIDLALMPANKIFVTTDASDTRSGAVLSFGKTWETARPVAFDSMTFKGAELNYPVHEKEMLAIMRALKKWRADLIGVPFQIYTDHKTLQNFTSQRDLSRRQARWMEFFSQYDGHIVYVKGEDNTVADALSRLPTVSFADSTDADSNSKPPFHLSIAAVLTTSHVEPLVAAAAIPLLTIKIPPLKRQTVSHLSVDGQLLAQIKEGYASDPWIKRLTEAKAGMPSVRNTAGLWFIGDRLVIPRVTQLREAIFRLAHDVLGHFGPDKSYEALRHSFYWPNMRRDLQHSYVPACPECQRNKSSTKRPIGPLHPLPVPDGRCTSIAMDFIGPLPLDEGYDSILTITDRLGSDLQIIPTTTTITAEQLADIFFNRWYCENGLPDDIISDRDKLFMSKFWRALLKLTGVKLKASTAYHPETDGASERSNKTVIQSLRFHVERNQRGWVRALPRVRFNIMNTVNKSTGFTPFQLRFGRSPRILPSFLPPADQPAAPAEESARDVIDQLQLDVLEAQDNLLRAKISQAAHANKGRILTFPFQVGQRVRLSTENRRREFKALGEKRVAKFMPRFGGPWKIIAIDEKHSTVTLDLPNSANFHPVFHTSDLIPHLENDDILFPTRARHKPKPVQVVTERRNTSSIASWTRVTGVEAGNTLFVGEEKARKVMYGFHVANWRIVRRSTSG